MDFETFSTRRQAKATIAQMRGWTARAVKLFLPEDPKADREGNAWVIECEGRLYLRKDGYVR